jgi:hypothetical protein
VPTGTHNIKQQRGFSRGDVRGYREKDILVDQLVLPIAAVAVEPHIATLLEALISKSLPAGAAFPAKIHQENGAGGADGGMSVRAGRNDNPGRLMTRGYG